MFHYYVLPPGIPVVGAAGVVLAALVVTEVPFSVG
jgi:hypothetical protein